MDKTSDCRSLPGTDYRELQEIAQKAKRLAGVYNHGELAKLIREYSHSEKAIEQIAC